MSEKCSVLILDFCRPNEGRILLESLKKFANFNKEIVYMCNGGDSQYAYDFYKEDLIDTLIIKKVGDGAGYGQTDLFRYCKTKYAIFCQVDQFLIREINQDTINYFISLLNSEFKCIDLNGDQSNQHIWTDRCHLIKTDFFNSLSPFPNGGPGADDLPWNERYLQDKFKENNYKIAHISPLYFADSGKWSIRQAGDGLFRHRCDLKTLYVENPPTYKTEVYPPLNETEWQEVLSGNWPKEGKVPEKWKDQSFRVWND